MSLPSTPVVTPPSPSLDLDRRLARLERSNRLLSLALVGAIGVVAGAVMMAASQSGAGASQGGGARQGGNAATPQDRSNCKPVSIVLDPSRGSGRWNSTLLAVDTDGQVYMLDTTRQQTFWRRFEFSP